MTNVRGGPVTQGLSKSSTFGVTSQYTPVNNSVSNGWNNNQGQGSGQ